MPSRRATAADPESSGLAPYARVREALLADFRRGRYPPGSRMPSESELVERFGVSRMTVGRALRDLQASGLIERRQGSGTFATQPHKVASTLRIRDIHEEITGRGHRHRASVHLCRAEPAPRDVAARLGLSKGDAVFHTVIVHFENDVALQCEDRYVNPACAPGYLAVDFTRMTPTHYLLDVAPFWKAGYTIEAALPGAREARLLGIGRTEPCLVVTRLTENRQTPITLARLTYPGLLYQLEGAFEP